MFGNNKDLSLHCFEYILESRVYRREFVLESLNLSGHYVLYLQVKLIVKYKIL